MEQLSILSLDEAGAFALRGELDMASADEVSARLRAAPTAADLTLELSGLTFMDSTGLDVFLEAAGTRDSGSCVVLNNPSAPVARLLEIALPGGAPGLKVAWSDGGTLDGRDTHDAR